MANIISATGDSPPRPFGGIANDFEALGKGNILGILDLPGSLVGDVVTLPDVLIAHHVDQNRVNADPEGDDADGDDPNDISKRNQGSREMSDGRTAAKSSAKLD
ncbi:MAG TPA: hypothetical protein VGM05_08290 [Planctomycetaceae bacterium]|jgi:uncharacterized protein YceK